MTPLTTAVAALALLQGGPAVEKKNPTFEEMIRMRVVWSVPGMDAVKGAKHHHRPLHSCYCFSDRLRRNFSLSKKYSTITATTWSTRPATARRCAWTSMPRQDRPARDPP